jgi:hypothetical protein
MGKRRRKMQKGQHGGHPGHKGATSVFVEELKIGIPYDTSGILDKSSQ